MPTHTCSHTDTRTDTYPHQWPCSTVACVCACIGGAYSRGPYSWAKYHKQMCQKRMRHDTFWDVRVWLALACMLCCCACVCNVQACVRVNFHRIVSTIRGWMRDAQAPRRIVPTLRHGRHNNGYEPSHAPTKKHNFQRYRACGKDARVVLRLSFLLAGGRAAGA